MKFSLPLTGGSIAFIAFQNIDRVILARYVSLEDMGVYGIGFMFGSIAGMIVTANMSAYLPRVKKVMASGDDKEVKRLTTHYMQEIQDLMLIVVFGIALFSELIVYFFANRYSGSLASIVMVGLALGHLARSNYLFFEQVLFLKDRVKSIFVVKLLILGIGLLVSTFLISQFKLYGASLIYLTTFLFINLVAYKMISLYGLVHISFKKIIIVGFIVLLLILLQYLNINSFFVYFIESIVIFCLSYRYLKLYIFDNR
jgi:O-antigen/teichoic acid export membrane protein